MPGRSIDFDGAPIGQFGDAGVLLHGHAGEVRHLLAQAGEAIEKRGLAGIRRADQRHGPDRSRAGEVPLPRWMRTRGNRRTGSHVPRLLGMCNLWLRFLQPNLQPARGFAPQGDLRTIHLEHARVAARSATPRDDPRSGQEAEFHQAAGVVARKVDAVEDRGIAFAQVPQGPQRRFRSRCCCHSVATWFQYAIVRNSCQYPCASILRFGRPLVPLAPSSAPK